ncbi:hypothetical protein A3Q56_02396 [Intoshia linei]|uniref:Uncharacterized protein n=1 Tax=Intoshia linei TaxID=1819745 RepID=A0A177B6G4_9BILA|nr:hypothetical protein A3Q56_02396 [Intoshia linei]
MQKCKNKLKLLNCVTNDEENERNVNEKSKETDIKNLANKFSAQNEIFNKKTEMITKSLSDTQALINYLIFNNVKHNKKQKCPSKRKISNRNKKNTFIKPYIKIDCADNNPNNISRLSVGQNFTITARCIKKTNDAFVVLNTLIKNRHYLVYLVDPEEYDRNSLRFSKKVAFNEKKKDLRNNENFSKTMHHNFHKEKEKSQIYQTNTNQNYAKTQPLHRLRRCSKRETVMEDNRSRRCSTPLTYSVVNNFENVEKVKNIKRSEYMNVSHNIMHNNRKNENIALYNIINNPKMDQKNLNDKMEFSLRQIHQPVHNINSCQFSDVNKMDLESYKSFESVGNESFQNKTIIDASLISSDMCYSSCKYQNRRNSDRPQESDDGKVYCSQIDSTKKSDSGVAIPSSNSSIKSNDNGGCNFNEQAKIPLKYNYKRPLEYEIEPYRKKSRHHTLKQNDNNQLVIHQWPDSCRNVNSYQSPVSNFINAINESCATCNGIDCTCNPVNSINPIDLSKHFKLNNQPYPNESDETNHSRDNSEIIIYNQNLSRQHYNVQPQHVNHSEQYNSTHPGQIYQNQFNQNNESNRFNPIDASGPNLNMPVQNQLDKKSTRMKSILKDIYQDMFLENNKK